jgi:hypothetical protein
MILCIRVGSLINIEGYTKEKAIENESEGKGK